MHRSTVVTSFVAIVVVVVSALAEAPATQPTTAPVVVEQATAGWRLRFPGGWQPPKPDGGNDVVDHWDRQGVGHRVPPGADTEVFIGPMLVWWGDEVRPSQSIEEVAKILAGHHGFAEKVTLGEVTDAKVADLPAKRAAVSFNRSIAFAPPGRGHGRMRATMILIRANRQENGLWFEAPEADFEAYEKHFSEVLRHAQVIERKPRKD